MMKPGVTVADIGTDHAYLPVYLIQAGLAQHVLACDIGAHPLANAARTVARYQLEDHITLRLSNGLDAVSPEDAEVFVFAGMGGTLITRLLTQATWIDNSTKQFIFQPMTRAEELRTFLMQRCFAITQEQLCVDEGRIYCAFTAQYDAAVLHRYPPGYAYYGEVPRCRSPLAGAYIGKQLARVTKRADALEQAGLLPEECAALREIEQDIREVLACL